MKKIIKPLKAFSIIEVSITSIAVSVVATASAPVITKRIEMQKAMLNADKIDVPPNCKTCYADRPNNCKVCKSGYQPYVSVSCSGVGNPCSNKMLTKNRSCYAENYDNYNIPSQHGLSCAQMEYPYPCCTSGAYGCP